jgi:hypothetical protein
MPTIPRSAFGLLMILGLSATACDDAASTGDAGEGGGSDNPTGAGNGSNDGGNGEGGGSSEPQVDPALEARVVDYNEALRKASLKLVRRLPTLEQIRRVENAADGREAYEAELDAMLATPEFTAQTLKMWRDTMRMGGDGLDTAPVFAAKIMAEGRDFTELFTATAGNCPTLDTATGTFTEGDCASGAPFQSGLLTNPAVMRQFYGNMAFRRARWVQETFYCSKFPAEVAAEPEVVDGKDYVSPWPFDRIASSPINFLDTSSVVCANCHATMNRVAPALAHFDQDGMWTDGFGVMTPIAPEPIPTELSHWLPEGEALAWRQGQPITTVADLGALLAEDPLVTECMTARLWNFAFGKEDIVSDLATVPFKVVEPHVLELDQSRDLKATLRGIFASEDFVSF